MRFQKLIFPQKDYTWTDFERGRQKYFEDQKRKRQQIQIYLESQKQKQKLAFPPAVMSAVMGRKLI